MIDHYPSPEEERHNGICTEKAVSKNFLYDPRKATTKDNCCDIPAASYGNELIRSPESEKQREKEISQNAKWEQNGGAGNLKTGTFGGNSITMFTSRKDMIHSLEIALGELYTLRNFE